MYVYAIDTPTLMQFLHSPESCTQLCYADDASAGDLLKILWEWFLLMCSCGSHFGYFPEPSKCFLVVASSQLSLTNDIFGPLSIQYTDSWVVLLGTWIRDGIL